MPPKPQLTPEERKALKIQKKAQRKLALIEKKKQLKRDVISREIKYSNVTLKKYEKEWKEMLTKIALPQIRDDLEFAWHNFERIVDCKDFTISLLLDELRFAERQYSMNFKNHMENIDKFIDMYQERLEEIKKDYDTQVSNLRIKCEEDLEAIETGFDEEVKYLKTIIHMLGLAQKTQKSNMRADYFYKIEEEYTKNSQYIQKIKMILEDLQGDYKNKTEKFLETYRAQIKDRTKQHDILIVRDESLQTLLQKQVGKLRKEYDNIKLLKQNFSDSQKILGRKLKDLEEEHNFFFTAFNYLKNRLITDRQKDSKQLKHLTVCYNDSNDYLEKLRMKGEQILHIAEVCRKLETQQEKITPFPLATIKTSESKTAALTAEVIVNEYVPEMELFFQRLGQAETLRYAMNEEREFLKSENQILKMKLHRYCQCLSCPIEEKNVSREIKHITEGANEYKKYQKQGFKNFVGKEFDGNN